MPMLTQDDLKQIRDIVRTEVDASEFNENDLKAIGEIVKAETGPIKEGLATLEESMNIKFDAVHEDIETLRNQMVTKSYLDDKLAHYVKRPF